MTGEGTVGERFVRLRDEVEREAQAAGRAAHCVAILGVSKKHDAQRVREAVDSGLRDVGENYVQEAREKFEQLGDLRFARHFIGHLQTNKAKPIAATFDVVQSVDRLDAAHALSKAASMLGKELRVLVQLNVSPAERFGCLPADAPALAEAIRALPALRLDGVMAIGPVTDDVALIRDAFAIAAKTFDRIGGSTLSIGMSGDWREAIRAGSTMIRIGRALFGPRPVPVGTPTASQRRK